VVKPTSIVVLAIIEEYKVSKDVQIMHGKISRLTKIQRTNMEGMAIIVE
jgi:hypothetical protein